MLNTTLNFDEFGNLTPYQAIDTLEAYFVTAFPKSTTRKRLFENYLRYIYRFQDEVFPFFEQYINGSFVTKKENPKDIDLVRDYPTKHPFFIETQKWKNYWSDLYSKNKHTDRSKGFLKIIFEK